MGDGTMRLTQKAIAKLAPGRYTDDHCKSLTLLVTRTGGRSWVQRLTVNGRRVDRGLGGAEFVTLAEARETASRNRYIARRGGDPFGARDAERTAATAPTFGAAADSLMKTLNGKAANTIKTYRSVLNNLSRLTDRPVASITRAEVIDVLKGIGSQSARGKAIKIVRRVLDRAVVLEWAPSNVADNGGLAAAVGIEAAAPSHHPAAPAAECPGIFGRLTATGTAAADALGLIWLTAARLTEATGAEWREFDLDAGVWTVPADRMKANREHRVPLTAAAVAILERRRAAGQHDGLVFADRAGRVPSQNAVGKLAAPYTTHGCRAAFRTWADDTNRDGEAAEMALAHVTGNSVSRCYARSDLFDRRRELMADWARFLTA